MATSGREPKLVPSSPGGMSISRTERSRKCCTQKRIVPLAGLLSHGSETEKYFLYAKPPPTCSSTSFTAIRSCDVDRDYYDLEEGEGDGEDEVESEESSDSENAEF